MSKRLLDIAGSILGLTLLSPLFAVIALAILIDDPGPIFYQARRVGQHGDLFRLTKFRTMVVDADKQGPGITRSGDPRITRVGRLLRRAKLDELPQLINVLKGEMSLVGPRPETPRYVALYSDEQRAILDYMPGMTSRASLRFRNEESLLTGEDWERCYIDEIMPAKIAADLAYAREATVWRDIGLILQTAAALFR